MNGTKTIHSIAVTSSMLSPAAFMKIRGNLIWIGSSAEFMSSPASE
jgi:hypothetical protein